MLDITTPTTQKWKLDQLDKTVDDFEKRVADKVTEKQIPCEKDYINILLSVTGKCIVLMREIITLSAQGFPDGALCLARSLYEQVIVFGFLDSKSNDPAFQDYVDDYYLDYDYQSYKYLKAENDYFPLKPDDLKKLNQEYDRIKAQAHRGTPKRDYWWTGINSLDQIIKAIPSIADPVMSRMLNLLHLDYKRACLSIHSNSFGNSIRLGINDPSNVIDNSPTLNGHGLPLSLSTVSFIFIVAKTCEALDIDYFGLYKDDLNHIAAFYRDKQCTESEMGYC
ncbi:DUF5677 domain-containing protein [uncultured Ruminococcus sp.]|uniref:DUF5677 domain-containing protein n=1 Tax=uncultured Ruminococcus sp. TaxID=165186 RepID=UPI0029302365|nr:DUF5677 domain-containing protein [uncultured Ruminococcus sp.]